MTSQLWRSSLKSVRLFGPILLMLSLGASLTNAESDSLAPIERAIAINPKDASSWRALGTRLYNAQRYGESRWVMQQALTLQPDDRVALWVAGFSAYKLGDWEAAKDALFWKLYTKGGLEQKDWPPTIDKRVTFEVLGRLFLSEDDLFSANIFFDKACSDVSKNWQCQFLLGYVELNRGRWADAENALARARSLQPHSAVILRYYARAKTGADQRSLFAAENARDHNFYPEAASDVIKAQREYAEDESLVNEAVQANPSNSYAYDLLGEYQASQGRFSAAAAALRKAIALDWTNIQARLCLARVILQIDPDDKHSEAESQLVRAIAINPNFWTGSKDAPHVDLLRELLERQGRNVETQALISWQAANAAKEH